MKRRTRPLRAIHRSHRNNRGSMLVLTILVMCFVMIVIAQLSGFAAMMMAHQELQDKAEKFEIGAVQILNQSDRTGRMNLMTAASRELVYDSRQTFNGMMQNAPAYAALAERYLNESRAGAQLVSDERQKLLASTLSDVRDLAKGLETQSQAHDMLPWVSTEKSAVFNLELGYAEDEDSNVVASDADPSLYEYDRENRSFDKSTNLYHGNACLKLPAPDDDLDFQLSSLAAPVSGTVSQAKIDEGRKFVATLPLIREGEFLPGNCKYIPSTARLTCVEKFNSKLGVSTHQRIAASVCGTTNGACEPAL